MQISPHIVGRKLQRFCTEVTWRQITNYAAAVGDLNPFYLDDTREEGLVAPPTLAAALTWPIIQNLSDYVDLGYSPEILMRMVHYSEQLFLHRPLRPGDRLTVEGEVAAVLPSRKGTHVVFKFPAVDAKGVPVFTEYIGGMLRSVTCTGEGIGAENLPAVPRAVSERVLWEVPQEISREAPYLYDGCAGVAFPIHTSPAFARSVGLPDIIYHGVATLAQAVRELVNREAGADPTAVKRLSCRFRGMVIPGSTIRIQLIQRDRQACEKALFFRVLNEEGREAVSEGYMVLAE